MQFCLHTLSSGGETAGANFAINDGLFQKQGRWKSEIIKDGYAHENTKIVLIDKSPKAKEKDQAIVNILSHSKYETLL